MPAWIQIYWSPNVEAVCIDGLYSSEEEARKDWCKGYTDDGYKLLAIMRIYCPDSSHLHFKVEEV